MGPLCEHSVSLSDVLLGNIARPNVVRHGTTDTKEYHQNANNFLLSISNCDERKQSIVEKVTAQVPLDTIAKETFAINETIQVKERVPKIIFATTLRA